VHRIILAAALSVALSPLWASADELSDLRAENARLRERVGQLERENARLRSAGADPERLDEAAIAERVTVEAGDAGTVLTSAEIPLDVTEGSRADHALTLKAEGSTVRATFRSWFTGGAYASVSEILVDADDRTFRLPVVDYDVTRVLTGPPQRRRRRDHERLTALLSLDELDAIASAHTTGGRLGRVQFRIDRDGQATIRAFERRAR